MRLFKDAKPVCLYTYETCYSRNHIIEFKADYGDVEKLVDKYYGRNRMDNKITLVFENSGGIVFYATYWDGNLAIGTSVHFFQDLKKPGNEYMTIEPIGE